MRGAISKKRGSQPRWPEKAEGMERSKRARRRKLDTAKTDLKPPLAVLRRAGCPPWGGIRRACGEVPGRNRWGNPRWTGRPKVGQGRVCTSKTKAFSFTHRTKVFAGGTVRKNNAWPQENWQSLRAAPG